MKRPSFILFVLAVLAAGIYFSSAYIGMKSDAFEARFKRVVGSAGYIVLAEEGVKGETIPLPPALRWRPRIQFFQEAMDGSDPSEAGKQYTLKASGALPIDCSVRYYDGCVCVAELRATPSQASAVENLRILLDGAFPDLPIRVFLQ